MVDSGYSMSIFKSAKKKYWNSNKKSRNVNFFPDHLKTKKISKHGVTKNNLIY